tara:strand:+ start:1982 stop:2230 length:249 start_codon:yes stop_codon:yes gene_type:complete
VENKYNILISEFIDNNLYTESLKYDLDRDIIEIEYKINGYQLGTIDNYKNKISSLLSDLKDSTITHKNLEILISEIAEAFSF